jgi:bacterioferritin-associated ferredoxin
MVVCVCSGSNEREIERAMDAGAASLAELGDACRAGLDCGSCRPTLQQLLDTRECTACPDRLTTCANAGLRLALAG